MGAEGAAVGQYADGLKHTGFAWAIVAKEKIEITAWLYINPNKVT